MAAKQLSMQYYHRLNMSERQSLPESRLELTPNLGDERGQAAAV